MIDDDDFSAEDERDLLAASFALGLAEGEEEARARQLVNSDAGFAGAVARWRGRLAGLADEGEAVEPPAELFGRIEQAIGGASSRPANDNGLAGKLAWWRGVAGMTGAVAAALALLLLVRPAQVITPAATPIEQPQPQGALVATIAGDSSALKMVATFDPGTRKLVVAAAVRDKVGKGRSRQLWMIPAGGKPVPMGVMGPGEPLQATLDADQAAQFAPGLTLAVSDEPEGGSPTGQPTGAVLATGTLARV